MAIKLRTFVFVIVLFLVILFAAVNWPLFMQTSTMNVLVGTVVAPLGIVMLAIVGGVSLLYLLILGKIETSALVGNRRTSKELEDARKLALSAEESRLTELRQDLQERLDRIEDRVNDIYRQGGTVETREVVRDSEPATVRVEPKREEII